ncbi:MAG TPA: lyase family protein, partial [Chloroflexota bacterium]|nr:lyase family protein [Chloroflexota bacterium]
DRPASAAAALGVTVGAMAKIAQDVALLGQTEVAEVSEERAPGKGGSSTMPHKRNPVDATLALAAARLALGQVQVILGAMPQEHERGVGGWQAEWEAIPSLFRFAGGAVAHTADSVAGLRIDTHRMRMNLEQGGDLLMAEALAMALAPHLGRPEAQRIVQAACQRATESGRSLRLTALEDDQVCAVLAPEAIESAFDPSRYLGSSNILINRALESYRALRAGI